MNSKMIKEEKDEVKQNNKKHGIFKNDTEQKFEAWKDGRVISKIGCLCKGSIIEIWKKRCEEYLKPQEPNSYDFAGLKLSEDQKNVLRKLGVDAHIAMMLQDPQIEENYKEFTKTFKDK
jgi:hypothetical protein